ncbi:ArnT family glycosyltransferase [Candidatus Pyrohabitans sp.]
MRAEELKSELLSYRGITIAALVITLLLFHFRGYDDNRTTSWRWVFASGDVSFILLLWAFAAGAAYTFSKVEIKERHEEKALFALALISGTLFLRMPEIMIDTARYFTYAKYAELYGMGYFVKEWGYAIKPWTDLPLVPLIYGTIFRFLGESRLYIQVFNLLLFAGSVLLTRRIGDVLFGRGAGFYAGLALLAFPYLLIQVPQMMVDVATMFFLTLAVYSTINALEKGTPKAITLASFSILLAFISKYSTWTMLSVLAVIFAVYLRKNMARTLRTSAIIAGLASVLIAVVMLPKLPVFLSQIELLRSYQGPGLKRWGESYISTFFFQVNPLITLAALYALYMAVKERRAEAAIPLWPFLLLLLMDVKRIRYTLPLFPMLALLAGYAISRIRYSEARRFIAGYAVAFTILLALFAYLPFIESLSVVNLRETGEFLDTLSAEEVEVHAWIPPNAGYNPSVAVAMLDLFTHKRIIYNPGAFPRPEEEKLLRSPVRFTWEYEVPPYYRRNSSGEVVVIIQRQHEGMPEHLKQRVSGLTLIESFNTTIEGLFRFRTLIDVYTEKKIEGG